MTIVVIGALRVKYEVQFPYLPKVLGHLNSLQFTTQCCV